jgi:excisionase family DNA binding protein
MKEFEKLTFDNLPEAIHLLLKDISLIKDHLLNNSVDIKNEWNDLPEKDFLTVKDVCQRLGLKKGSVYNMTHLNQIPFYKRGGRIYFDLKEIDEWIRSDRRKTIKQLQEEANKISWK